MAYRLWTIVTLGLSTLLLGLSLAWAATPGTVTAVDDKGVATVKTADGKEYQIFPGDMWRVGTKVDCEIRDGKAECKQPQ